MSLFVMLSGPSCVGKGPLYKALRKFYPDLAGRLQQIVLYNSRDPRPGEQEGVDYYFRPRAEIEELATKCNEGELTEAERREYGAYVDAIDLIGLLQAKARVVLARQPNS